MRRESFDGRDADFFYTTTISFIYAPEFAAWAPAPAAARIPESAGEDLKSRRELIALQYRLKAAVRDENFEKAIELRDRIKALEAAAYEK